jgi:hypothetical protein
MPVEDLVRFEPPKPLSALKVFDLGRIKDDLDVAGELQQVPGFPIWKSQAALRIDQEVAQRVEEQVAGKIRNRDDAVRANPHKTRFAAAMRDIDLPVAGLARDIGCNRVSALWISARTRSSAASCGILGSAEGFAGSRVKENSLIWMYFGQLP